jgi:hypothetical protein
VRGRNAEERKIVVRRLLRMAALDGPERPDHARQRAAERRDQGRDLRGRGSDGHAPEAGRRPHRDTLHVARGGPYFAERKCDASELGRKEAQELVVPAAFVREEEGPPDGVVVESVRERGRESRHICSLRTPELHRSVEDGGRHVGAGYPMTREREFNRPCPPRWRSRTAHGVIGQPLTSAV